MPLIADQVDPPTSHSRCAPEITSYGHPRSLSQAAASFVDCEERKTLRLIFLGGFVEPEKNRTKILSVLNSIIATAVAASCST
uniref:Uncharacterized protein n=1 Tax=Angiostrongylus cantonensis TaxID=6313 RepID=A0A0K0DLG7_ANGCA